MDSQLYFTDMYFIEDTNVWFNLGKMYWYAIILNVAVPKLRFVLPE